MTFEPLRKKSIPSMPNKEIGCFAVVVLEVLPMPVII